MLMSGFVSLKFSPTLKRPFSAGVVLFLRIAKSMRLAIFLFSLRTWWIAIYASLVKLLASITCDGLLVREMLRLIAILSLWTLKFIVRLVRFEWTTARFVDVVHIGKPIKITVLLQRVGFFMVSGPENRKTHSLFLISPLYSVSRKSAVQRSSSTPE